MDHFDVVTGTARSDPFTAWDVVIRADLRRDRLEHFLEVRPRFFAAAGHQAGALKCTFLTARYAAAAEQQTGVFDRLGPPFGVEIVGVAAVDDDVAGIAKRQ